MTTVGDAFLEATLQSARERAGARTEFVGRLRSTLRELATEGLALEPFTGGTVMDELRHQMLELRADFGDPLAAARRTRRNKKIGPTTRKAVYRRDRYTCVECRWRSPRSVDERKTVALGGRWLTIDHIIPLAEGGPNHISNMRTLCSHCNPAKGHELPDSVSGAAAA